MTNLDNLCRCGHTNRYHHETIDSTECIFEDCLCSKYVEAETDKPRKTSTICDACERFGKCMAGQAKCVFDGGIVPACTHAVNLPGVGPDAPVVYNEKGAGQSHSPYRFDLLPPVACADISEILAHGAAKYGEGSYLNIAAKDHLNHAMQHIFAFQCGDTQEGDVIEHAKHAACRMLFWLECLERASQ